MLKDQALPLKYAVARTQQLQTPFRVPARDLNSLSLSLSISAPPTVFIKIIKLSMNVA